jgi:hypothetical protein
MIDGNISNDTNTSVVADTITSDSNDGNETDPSGAYYDSQLAESIIRTRSELYRNESTRTSLTTSQSSGDNFGSNEFDGSTLSSLRDSTNSNEATLPIPPLKTASSAPVTTSRGLHEPVFSSPTTTKTEASSSVIEPLPKKSPTARHPIQKKNKKIVQPSEEPNSDEIVPTPTTLRRYSTMSTLTEARSRRYIPTESEEFISEPIVAFPVPQEPEPVSAVPVLMDDDNSNNDDDVRKKWSNSKQRRMILTLLVICITTAIIVATTIGGICGSGVVSCNSSGSKEIDARASSIIAHINSFGFDDEMTSSDDTLTQQAIDWIIEYDPLQLTVETNPFQLRQRYALTALWFHTTINGTWRVSSGWLGGEDECLWFGISCTVIDHGGDIGTHNTVTSIQISSNNLRGMLPSDMAFLSKLKTLKLDSNSIFGTIPESFGEFTAMEHVELQFNFPMTGKLPESLGYWTKINYVDISNNNFTGPIPSTVGNWVDLSFISASSNGLDSTMPSSLGQWSNVSSIDFNINKLHGTLPESIGRWSQITSFNVLGNNLTGTIPAGVGNWKMLNLIAISNNNFTGTIPEALAVSENLMYANFEINNFTGSMPQGLCKNLTTLVADCSIDCDCCTGCAE